MVCTDTWVTTKAPGAQPYERAVSGGLGPADRGRGGCCWTGVWRAHTHLLSTLPALISPFCSACRGPGQQGREAQAEGDHLRLWGVRVRGKLSNRGTGARGAPLAASGASCPGPSSGSAWGSSSAGIACASPGCPRVWPWARASLPTVDSWAWPFQAFAARASLGPPSVDPGCTFW